MRANQSQALLILIIFTQNCDHRLIVVQVVDFDWLTLQRKALSICVLYFKAPRAFSAHLSHGKAGIPGAADVTKFFYAVAALLGRMADGIFENFII